MKGKVQFTLRDISKITLQPEIVHNQVMKLLLKNSKNKKNKKEKIVKLTLNVKNKQTKTVLYCNFTINAKGTAMRQNSPYLRTCRRAEVTTLAPLSW